MEESTSKLDKCKVNLNNAINKLDVTKDRLQDNNNLSEALEQQIAKKMSLFVRDTSLPEVIELNWISKKSEIFEDYTTREERR